MSDKAIFKVGDTVKVTDQRPPAIGTVLEVSTWHKVLETSAGSNKVCYKIACDAWGGQWRWIGAIFVEAA